jgi:hypothetical protein
LRIACTDRSSFYGSEIYDPYQKKQLSLKNAFSEEEERDSNFESSLYEEKQKAINNKGSLTI